MDEIAAFPPASRTEDAIAAPMVCPFGKSAAVVSVPCQVIVQPPVCIAILLAPGPVTRTRAPGFMGKVSSLFFKRTRDLATASRANAKCAAAPTAVGSLRVMDWSPIKPSLYLTRKFRRTASSSRVLEMRPSRTSFIVFSKSAFQLSGAIKRSTPALMDAAHEVTVQPSTCPCPFQSPTTRPPKPMRSFNTSVRRLLLP